MVSPWAVPDDERLGGHWLFRFPWKEPVRVAATGNVTISSLNAGDTIDGVTVALYDRVLLPLQTLPKQNGIYVIGTNAGETYRAGDFATGDDVPEAMVWVRHGTANAGTFWHCTTADAPTIDTDDIDWEQFASGSGPVVPFDHGSMGATETVDLADSDWHRGTLSANCTITVQGFTVDVGSVLLFEVTQNGTGGWGITWDADVDFGGADDQPVQTALATTVFLLFSSAGDSTIYGAKVGPDDLSSLSPTTFIFPGASSPAQTAEGSAVWDTDDDVLTIGTGASRKTFGYLGSTTPLVESGTGAAGTSKEVAAADHVHPATSSVGGHMHVAGETHLSDGATGTYTLDLAFEVESVIAWNKTTIARLTVTETQPDQVTVSPVGTSGDAIVFDYAATVV